MIKIQKLILLILFLFCNLIVLINNYFSEIDYIFYGYTLGVPEINTEEVHSYRWANIADIYRNIEETPDSYTEWFKSIVLEKGISQMADSVKSNLKRVILPA